MNDKSARKKTPRASKRRRSNMAAIRSKGNQATELSLLRILRRHNISGWRRHLELPGTPDFAFVATKVAVFVDGCFWHGCPRHFRKPRGNNSYWGPKLRRNRARDRRVDRVLRQGGWSVLRIWEHALQDEQRIARHITSSIKRQGCQNRNGLKQELRSC